MMEMWRNMLQAESPVVSASATSYNVKRMYIVPAGYF
jgi:hypothetical protein